MTASVRYIVDDVDAAIAFYTERLGFTVELHPAPGFAMLSRGDLRLRLTDPQEIAAWGRHLDKVMAASGTEDLWAAAYLINGGCSDEGFDAFRGWLIAHGREVVARSVREPDSLADLPAVRSAAASAPRSCARRPAT